MLSGLVILGALYRAGPDKKEENKTPAVSSKTLSASSGGNAHQKRRRKKTALSIGVTFPFIVNVSRARQTAGHQFVILVNGA